MTITIEDLCTGEINYPEQDIEWNKDIVELFKKSFQQKYNKSANLIYKNIIDNIERFPYFLRDNKNTIEFKYYKKIYNVFFFKQVEYLGKLQGYKDIKSTGTLCKLLFSTTPIPASVSAPRILKNFIFVRHGHSCQNLVGKYYKPNQLEYYDLLNKYCDPTLSDIGYNETIESRTVMDANLLKHGIDKIDLYGSSPMIRAIETAYLLTETEKTNVFPHLREISSDYKNTRDTSESLDEKFPMKSIKKQLEYFNNDSRINMDYMYGRIIRFAPGNIANFIGWFLTYGPKNVSNVLIVTHAHVIKQFSGLGVYNNNGFILPIMNDKYNVENIIPLENNLNKNVKKTIECPTKRCPGFC